MEYNSENMKLKTPPPAHLRLKYLKIDLIRISIIRKVINKNNYISVLNKSITENRTIING
jgi:hypothetical protein